ncbi:MAG: hypothetical protein J0H98_07150 [Solirubrobacterales bacterium]|nr:hypothetical protein [Solirubrobacterales bacterium]
MKDTNAEWNPDQHGTISTYIREPRPTGRQLLAAIVICLAFLAGAYTSYEATIQKPRDTALFGDVDPTAVPPNDLHIRVRPNQPQGTPEGPQVPYPENPTLQ